MDRHDKRSVAEIIGFCLLIGAHLWLGRRSLPGANVVFGAAALFLLISSHRRAGEGLRKIGFRLDNFNATLVLLAPPAIIGAAIALGSALYLGEMHFPSLWSGLRRFAEFVVLGVLQQYVLLGFLYTRLTQLLKGRFALVLTAAVFALLHLPNGFLVAVTFVAGIVACSIYRKSPNLFANGLVHGALATLLYYGLPRGVTGGLRVGMDYVVLP